MRQRAPARGKWWPAALLACCCAAAQAQAPAQPSLADLSLEQLSSIEVTSVGKRVQRLADVPGSVFVIQQEDIRRSGALTLPEALRLAPNLQVARADANQYAVTARGFNSVLANKMLVLIDGRTVYSPLFSGVFWEEQDLLLDDIERIEVLSGAGGTLYGSNAVNGVINVITRSSAETTGALVKGGGGNQERLLGARVGGGTPAGTTWRVYAKRYETDATRLESGASTGDASRRSTAGFRADRALGNDQLTLQGDIYRMEADQLPGQREMTGGNLLARWSREHGGGARTQVQAYYDRHDRDQPGSIQDRLDTWDIELQQTSRPGGAHELLWGAGYRSQRDSLVNIAPATIQIVPPERRMNLANVFIQDEFNIAPEVRLTAGIKAEHNSYTGLEWLPTLRAAWHPLGGHVFWASASRAVRTPARIDRDLSLPSLGFTGANLESEIANVFELGYRAQPHKSLSYSATLFHHRFERLRSVDVMPGGLAFANSIHGQLSGVESWATWRISDQWRLQAGYTWQTLHLGTDPGATVLPGSNNQLANDPRQRAQLGVAWDVARNVELDLQVRHVGSLPNPLVPGYTAVDLRLGWRVRPDLELSVSARNLTDANHPEWGAAGTRAEIPRSFFFKAVWRP